MVYTASKLVRALCSMVVMLALVASIASVPVLAASNGIYLATATPHYKHPTMGFIEDSGGEGSAVLGQSMTDSATHKQALVEVDPSGNTFVTVRLKLMDNIEDPQFQVDANQNGTFTPVSSTRMQEDYTNNTADFRMQVPSENAIIRCNMYVVPMGRMVIFYITVGNLQSGSGDFVTSVTVNEQPAQDPVVEPADTKPAASSQSENSEPETASSQPASVSSSTHASSQATSSTPASSSSTSSSPASAAGLQEFDASGNRVSEAPAQEEGSSGSGAVVAWVIGAIVVLLAAGGCVWYFCFFKKKK